MNTRTFKLSWGIAALAAAAVVIVGYAALVARADSAPAITNAIQNGSNATVASAPIGSSVHDLVTVASSTSSTTPTGTVDFNLFPNTSCSGTPATQSAVTLVNGSAQSATTTVPATGLSYTVHYSGDASTTAANSGCQALTATAASVSLGTNLSTSTVLAGSSVYDTATLSGNTADATGTVAYTVYTNNLCTAGAQSAGTKTVSNGSVPNSNALVFNAAGTYFWQAVYSGDQHNAAATSACTSEQLVVQATSTPVTPPPTTSTPGTISGNVFNDLNKNDIKDSNDPGLSGWTIWLHFGNKKDGYDNPIVQTTTTDANGNYGFSNLALGKYFVEEKVQSGWKQTSDDMRVTIGSTTGATVNFANIMKNATSTKPGNGHGQKCDGDNDADDVGCTATTTQDHDNGNHFGWFKHFWGNFNFHFTVNHGNSGKGNGKDD